MVFGFTKKIAWMHDSTSFEANYKFMELESPPKFAETLFSDTVSC